MVRLGLALFFAAFLFGGLPQSSAVREQLARSGLVSSGRPEVAAPTTTTTAPPPPAEPVDVQAVLESSGYPEINAVVDGRAVTLTGVIPDDASHRVVVGLVQDIPGVDSVIDETTVGAPAPIGDATITATSSRIALEGAVGDAATAEAVLDAVTGLYLADQIDGAVTVDPAMVDPALIVVSVKTTRTELVEQLEARFDALDPLLVTVDFRPTIVAVPPVESELGALLDAEPVTFAIGEATVEEGSLPTLDAIAATLVRFPDATLEVGGHTDTTGSSSINRSLSAERAETVIAELRDRGIENTLVAAGYGDIRPKITPADSNEARAANRRIEFLVIDS